MNITLLSDTTRVADANSADFNSHGHRGMIAFLDIDAVVGTSPTVDVKFQAKSPNGDYVDIPGASFAQKTGAGTSMLTMALGVTASGNVAVNQPLPSVFRAVAAMGTTGGTPEVQTLDLGDIDTADTFKLATGAGATAKTATITFNAVAATMATDIQTKLNAVLGVAAVTVVSVDGNTFTITWAAVGNTVQIQVTDTATFSEKTDGGYVLGVITTTPGTADETWNGSLTAQLI